MLSFPLDKNGPLHKKVLSKLSDRLKWAIRSNQRMHPEWRKAEEAMNAYVPPTDADDRRQNRRDSGDPQFTTMMVPYSFAVVMAAHTYFTSVMLARNPIHQFMGLSGEGQNSVEAVQTLLQYQSSMGGMMVPYYSWLYDAARIGHGVIRHNWEKEVRTVAIIEEVQTPDDPQAALFGNNDPLNKPGTKRLKLEDIEVYEGNKVSNVSPFDFLPDPRVPLQDFQKGEFCGHFVRNVSWNTIKERERQGYYINVDHIKSTVGQNPGSQTYQGDTSKERPDEYTFTSTEGETNGHPAVVNLYELYIYIIPSEFEIGNRDRPELWCFTITADMGLIIGATPVGYYHCKFPYDVLKVDMDAYSSFARGIPRQLESVQYTMDWLLNTHFYNVRAALQNLFVVDPTRVRLADLEDPLPGGIIRCRVEAAGTDLRTAIHQIPIADVTRQHLNEIPFMQGIGERIVGVNDSVIGAMESGSSRKTATEVRTASGFSVNRMKTQVEFMSHMGMGPHALKLLQNTQQFFSAEKKLTIAGDAMQFAQRELMITPQMIAGGYQFVHVDGTLPSDRLAEAKLMQELLMQMSSFPQMAMQYDIPKMVLWAVSRAGLKNAEQFKLSGPLNVQVRPPEELAREAERGNLIPRTPASRGIAPAVGNSDGGSGPIV